jgi:predicted DNA-binding protein (MmcQ/YjbR family)
VAPKKPKKPKKGSGETAAGALREFALTMPGAYEDFPWGERVVKVNKKVFVFLGMDDQATDQAGLSVKLPVSSEEALALPCTEPTGYGLGRSGWVTIRYGRRNAPPLDAVLDWIEESYRAVAPKKLIGELDGRRRT